MPMINKIVSEINKLSLKEQEAELHKVFPEFFTKEKKEETHELPELPDVKDKVVMRLAPYPSGALHIGNTKTYMLNALYCEKYKGKLVLFMDDTIGSAEKYITMDAYKLMPEGFKWVGANWHGPILYKSKRMSKYYAFAEDLIKRDLAYVCECPVETLRQNRLDGKDCFCRANSKEVNLSKWKDMLAKKYKQGTVALRLKTSMQHPNPAFRDRVLAKIVERSHPLVGKKYTVWPTLELSWAYDDHDIGSTHILRGNDLVIESDTCRFIWERLGWKIPVMIHTGMIRLKGVKISKSKALKEVESGVYSGWEDPRTWSLQSLRRRGIRPEAIRSFIKEIGLNVADIEVPIDNLYNFNRKMIDSIADRYFFVPNPMKIKVSVDAKFVSAKIHPDRKDMRKVPVTKFVYIDSEDFKANKGQEVRLKDLANVKLDKVAKTLDSKDTSVQKLQWAPTSGVKVEIVMVDGSVVNGIGEPLVAKVKVGKIVQFERFGFARCEKKNRFVFAHK